MRVSNALVRKGDGVGGEGVGSRGVVGREEMLVVKEEGGFCGRGFKHVRRLSSAWRWW